MLRFFALFLSACALSSLPVLAQTPGQFEPEYLLRTQNTPGVRQNYTLQETTTVTRTGANGTPAKYQRTVVYYLTQSATAPPEKGFTTVTINLDSMTYYMAMGDNEWTYDSQEVTDNPTLTHPDIETSTALLNRPFTVTLSPYGELVKTESDEIDWLKNYVLVEGRTVLDTTKKFVWLDGVSPEVIRHLSDVRLGLLPFTFVKPDSTWHRFVSLRADGIDFQDTAAVRVESLNNDEYTISATADSLQPVQRSVYKFERPTLADVRDGSGSATMKLILSRYGMVQSAQWSMKAEVLLVEGGEEFTETMSKDYSLQLTGQYRW